MKKTWMWLLLGWVVGSYFGLSHLMSMFGGKKSA